MNQINIRKAKISDIQNLSQLTNSLSHFYLENPYLETKGSPMPNWLAESFTETQFLIRIESDDFSHFIAENDNQLIGFIAIKQPNHLYHLFVDEAYHGQAIGKQLWQYAVENLQLENQDFITVRASLYAIPVYEKFGFVAIDNLLEKDGLKFLPMQKNQNS